MNTPNDNHIHLLSNSNPMRPLTFLRLWQAAVCYGLMSGHQIRGNYYHSYSS